MGFYDSIIIFYRIVTTFSTLFSYDGCTAILITFSKIIIFFCSRNYMNFLFECKMWYANHILLVFWCQFFLVSKQLEFKILYETFDGWFFYLIRAREVLIIIYDIIKQALCRLGAIWMILLRIRDNKEYTLIIQSACISCCSFVCLCGKKKSYGSSGK